jgi:hypothetical protein
MKRDHLIKAATCAIDKAPTSTEAARRIIDMVLDEAANVCAPHSDDDKLDRQAKAECATAIRKLKGARDDTRKDD